MDVYHKILVKVFEITGGKENSEVDLTDLLKREGFYANIESINDFLCSEGWMVAGSRKHTVRITHWGVAEAKRTLADTTDVGSVIAKDAERLLKDSREMIIMLEEFSASASKDKFSVIEKRFAELSSIISRIAAKF